MSEKQNQLTKLEAVARDIGSLVGQEFDKANACFALLGFIRGHGDRCFTWVSNANRQDMIAALRETADILELEADSPPLHGQGPGPGHKGAKAQ